MSDRKPPFFLLLIAITLATSGDRAALACGEVVVARDPGEPIPGCAPEVPKTAERFDPEKLAQVKVGITTYAQLVALLGAPGREASLPENRRRVFYRDSQQSISFQLDPDVVLTIEP